MITVEFPRRRLPFNAKVFTPTKLYLFFIRGKRVDLVNLNISALTEIIKDLKGLSKP